MTHRLAGIGTMAAATLVAALAAFAPSRRRRSAAGHPDAVVRPRSHSGRPPGSPGRVARLESRQIRHRAPWGLAGGAGRARRHRRPGRWNDSVPPVGAGAEGRELREQPHHVSLRSAAESRSGGQVLHPGRTASHVPGLALRDRADRRVRGHRLRMDALQAHDPVERSARAGRNQSLGRPFRAAAGRATLWSYG